MVLNVDLRKNMKRNKLKVAKEMSSYYTERIKMLFHMWTYLQPD
jgi:hypothetical protein